MAFAPTNVKLDVTKGNKNGSASGKYRNRKRVSF
jgi:hypothetical protein